MQQCAKQRQVSMQIAVLYQNVLSKNGTGMHVPTDLLITSPKHFSVRPLHFVRASDGNGSLATET